MCSVIACANCKVLSCTHCVSLIYTDLALTSIRLGVNFNLILQMTSDMWIYSVYTEVSKIEQSDWTLSAKNIV